MVLLELNQDVARQMARIILTASAIPVTGRVRRVIRYVSVLLQEG